MRPYGKARYVHLQLLSPGLGFDKKYIIGRQQNNYSHIYIYLLLIYYVQSRQVRCCDSVMGHNKLPEVGFRHVLGCIYIIYIGTKGLTTYLVTKFACIVLSYEVLFCDELKVLENLVAGSQKAIKS